MPARIATATLQKINTEELETSDAFPGTYGFEIQLSCDPGEEWETEFEGLYEAVPYPGKPPVSFRGDRLCVWYLPRYASDLPRYLEFLKNIVVQTNRAVEKRNAVLPENNQEQEAFRAQLRALQNVVCS